jgi:WD40 repeat protein
MPRRNDKGFEHERLAFEADIAAARAALESGNLSQAVDLAVDPAHKFWYGKDPLRFELLSDLHHLLAQPFAESAYRENPWQRKLMAELYEVWPKIELVAAILKQEFPEADADDLTVGACETVQLTKFPSGFLTTEPVVFSQSAKQLKLWDLETGEVIYAEDFQDLMKLWLGFVGAEGAVRVRASTIGRDSSHILFSYSLVGSSDCAISFRETLRRISTSRAGTYEKSKYANARRYAVRGEVVSIQPKQELELDRAAFEKSPIRGEIQRPREFKPQTPQYLEWLSEVYSAEEVKEILEEDAAAKEREKQIVRVTQYQTLTLAHEEIAGYLPAQTSVFVAVDGFAEKRTVDDLHYGDRVMATLAVEDDESWIEEIMSPGHGLRSPHSPGGFTTPITAVCISSDGSLALANGCGNNFFIANLWTADCLREFSGHSNTVTCLSLSVDVSFAVSGSDDQTVRLWKPLTAECVRVFEGHEAGLTKVCISLDATKVLSADRIGVVKLWDVETGECLRTIKAHGNNVSALLITFDGKFAVSGSWDKTVKIWKLTDGSCMKTFEHDDWVTSVDMSADGHYLVCSSYDGTKVWELIWRLEPRDVVEWDEGARSYLEILMNANAAWDGKLGTPVDMTQEEIKNSLRRQSPSWHAWHDPTKTNDWHRVWHLGWDIEQTMGHAGYGWLSGIGEEGSKFMDEWKRQNPPSS